MEQKMYQQQKVSLKRKYANVSLKKSLVVMVVKLKKKQEDVGVRSLWRFNSCTILVLQD